MLSRNEEVRALIERFPDVPLEAVYKEDMLRGGLAFSEDALRISSGYKPKAYFIFSFDLVPISEMKHSENLRAPEEICLQGGPEGFRRTIVSVRLNPQSPYRIDVSPQGGLVLNLEGREICSVELPVYPDYYRRPLANGKPITDIAPTIEWGYLLYLTVFRMCQYFGRKVECQFCDINENYRQQTRTGRSYTAVKSVDEILEALEIIADTDSASKAYTVTGGSITSALQGMDEVGFYARYPEAIEKRFPGRWISKMVVQAQEKADLLRFQDAGVTIYHPNYEVWDPQVFERICSGKAQYIGRDEWIQRILDSADIFGPSNVIPNFVAGIEMSQPHGFSSVDEAIESTSQGLDFFMSRGISPRFTTWCAEPTSVLGRGNPGGAPLEYHVRLTRAWRDIHSKHELPAPPGYGTPGIGNAVFSVSSFMDVIRVPEPEPSSSVVN